MKITKIVLLACLTTIRLHAQPSLIKPFEDCNVKGSITIYDYNEKKWISSDIHDSHVGTLPASTFKIINTLIALETGAIADENEIVKWPGEADSTKYGHRPDIYHDMTMKEAFRVSAVWVYLALAEKIGKDTYKAMMEKCHYGNADVSIDDPDFWNFGSLAISPANQIEFLVGLYEETLPFSQRSFRILKEMMLEEQTETYTLRAKTGWTSASGKSIGWWVGYVEKEGNLYFFATRIYKNREDRHPDFGKCRKEITRAILNQLDMMN